MHFFKISTGLLIAIAASAMAIPTSVSAEDTPDSLLEEVAPGQDDIPDAPPAIVKRGYGCPGNPYQCNEHCKSLGGGRKGGYCGGPWWLGHPTCICFF
ncbi:hypothetical protein BJX63DRAFT_393443 [Aspergillus granulosus]|uniref:Invertebrate defensins family profile domain-containing protein n=1 Tax=Aspergillus granulosus TaxID=176169 RepID=A0ABR4HEE8_9EURO